MAQLGVSVLCILGDFYGAMGHPSIFSFRRRSQLVAPMVAKGASGGGNRVDVGAV